MLMRFWSKISRMFLCMFLLVILRLKNVYSIRPCNSVKTNDSFKNNVIYKLFVYKSYIFNGYTYKQDLALNSLKDLICYKTQPTHQPTNQLELFLTSLDINSIENL